MVVVIIHKFSWRLEGEDLTNLHILKLHEKPQTLAVKSLAESVSAVEYQMMQSINMFLKCYNRNHDHIVKVETI